MTRTRDWRRHQRERIRRRRAHYFTVRWAHELGDPRLIDIVSEHPQICSCDFCQNHYPRGKSPVELRAPGAPPPPSASALSEEVAFLDSPDVDTDIDWDDEEEDLLYDEMMPRVVYGRKTISASVVYVEPRFTFRDEEEVDLLDDEMLPRVAYGRETLNLPVVYVEPRFALFRDDEEEIDPT